MGFVSVAVPFQGSWYFDQVVDGVRQALDADGDHAVVHLVPYGPDARNAIRQYFERDMQDEQCIGAVAVTFRLAEAQLGPLRSYGKPVVIAGGISDGLPAARIDDAAAARIAVEHLQSLGHTAIVHLAGSTLGVDDSTMRADRIRGYSEAMLAAGLEDSATVRPSRFDRDAARQTAAELLSAEHPSAVFAANDELAAGVLDAAAQLGVRVPEELSVIGIDDHPSAAGLDLTTVRQVPADLGIAAVRRLRDPSIGDDQILPTVLVRRGTTAPMR